MAKTARSSPLFGIMNNPKHDVIAEIALARDLGCDFLDLTLEPPMTGPERFDRAAVKRALEKHALPVVGHTGWHLPGNAAYPEVRHGVIESLKWAADHFAALGARTMTYHIQGAVARYVGLEAAIEAQAEVLAAAGRHAEKLGVEIICEHVWGWPEQYLILDGLFARVPGLGFHLDVGHAHIGASENQAAELLRRYGDRLRHVHFSDNRGRGDDHMPLGVGTVPWPEIVRLLKARAYTGTITLETFSEDVDYVRMSLEKARSWFAGKR